MASFKLNGKAILPNNANCPVEVVANTTTTSSSGFFISNGTGKVNIDGVTDSGYHLVTANSSTIFSSPKVDVFGGKLKINGVSQPYCDKGKAPVGSQLTEYGSGTYYFYRRYDGYCELQDSNGSSFSRAYQASLQKCSNTSRMPIR